MKHNTTLPPAPTLAETLKERTTGPHATLEKELVGRLRALRTASDYYALLSVFYGFYGPLEARIAGFVTPGILPDIELRGKAGLLQNDIRFLGYGAPQAAYAGSLPQNLSQAMGALYVTEGSSLGGQVIAGMLKKQLDMDNAPLHFFNPYGSGTMLMWQTFKARLEEKKSLLDQEEVINGALGTFKGLKEWFDENKHPQ